MIVEGRISKTKKKMSLMDQPYIKNNEKDVQTFVKETIAQLGENIQVRRFERFGFALKSILTYFKKQMRYQSLLRMCKVADTGDESILAENL